MALEDDIAILTRAPLLGLMGRDALRLIAFAGEQRGLDTGEVLFRKGERTDGGYVVTRGLIVLDAAGSGSEPAFLAYPGALIGQTALFVRAGRRATAIARESSGVLRISPTLMRRVLEEFPAGAAAIHAAMAGDLDMLSRGLDGVRRRLEAIDAS